MTTSIYTENLHAYLWALFGQHKYNLYITIKKGWLVKGDKVSVLTHTYKNLPLRKIEVTMCNHQADSPLDVYPDVWSGDLQV